MAEFPAGPPSGFPSGAAATRAVRSARSLLFVPGSRPDRFDKAHASGADVVILDIEDAVAPADKDAARAAVARHLAGAGRAIVRVTPAGSPYHADDLSSLSGAPGLLGVMVPKSDAPEQVEAVHAALGVPVLPLLETAAGVLGAAGIARARGVARIVLGDQDLLADLGAATAEIIDHARFGLAYAAAAAGLPGPVDGVSLSVKNSTLVSRDAERARMLGFSGKLCIHPAQVRAVNDAFVPSVESVEWARGIERAATGAVAVAEDGTFVDAPVLRRARNILDSAEAAAARGAGK